MSLSKIELKKQLRALGVKIEGNYVRKSDIKKLISAEKKTIADAKEVIQQKWYPVSNNTNHIQIIDSFHPKRILDNDDEIEYKIYRVDLDPHGDADVYIHAQNRIDASEAAEEWWLENHPKEKEIEAVRVQLVNV